VNDEQLDPSLIVGACVGETLVAIECEKGRL